MGPCILCWTFTLQLMWELKWNQELREWVSNPFCTIPGHLTGELTVCCTVISMWSLLRLSSHISCSVKCVAKYWSRSRSRSHINYVLIDHKAENNYDVRIAWRNRLEIWPVNGMKSLVLCASNAHIMLHWLPSINLSLSGIPQTQSPNYVKQGSSVVHFDSIRLMACSHDASSASNDFIIGSMCCAIWVQGSSESEGISST